MKTLYININGEIIQSTDDIIVVGRPEDAIVNKFIFELGKEIQKDVSVPGVASIKKKSIVTDFKTHDEKSYNLIIEQWEILKQELLGENPSGTRTVKLPDEYISWLQNSSQPVYAEIAKSLYKRGGNVEVSLDKIYKNAIGIIVNNIEPEECKDCGQFVVNDEAVTDDSAITISIQERVPQIAFLPFEDFGKCPKCGKKPCECVPEPPVCPKCGKNPCECKEETDFIDKILNLYGITLGETSFDTLNDEEREKCKYEINCDTSGHIESIRPVEYCPEDGITFAELNSKILSGFVLDFQSTIPSQWKEVLKHWDGKRKKCIEALNLLGYTPLHCDGEYYYAISHSNNYTVFVVFHNVMTLDKLYVFAPVCPICYSQKNETVGSGSELHFKCSMCGGEFGPFLFGT